VCLLQYFVSSDVGGGKQQWYGFHKEPADGEAEGQQQTHACHLSDTDALVVSLSVSWLSVSPQQGQTAAALFRGWPCTQAVQVCQYRARWLMSVVPVCSAAGQDPPGVTRKERLLEIFGHW
jgi:hypothetical protein